MTGPPPELFANSLEDAGYAPCELELMSSLSADLIPSLVVATPSLNRPLATLLNEKAWVLVRRFDYSACDGCIPPTKTLSEWWPILARKEYVSVRGDYFSKPRLNSQLKLSPESRNSGLRRRMTIRELQSHFDRPPPDAGEDSADVGNCLNATEIRIIPNSALSRRHRRPIQMREEDMTRFVDTKGKWGKDHIMVAEKGAWVVRGMLV